MIKENCPFCLFDDGDIIAENEYCYATYDKYPVSPGHTLIISRRHITEYFELSNAEKQACWSLIDEVKVKLESEYKPDGWNVGINCGSVAGQTIFHHHCHLIPRYKGDMKDPRGGVRHSLEGKGYY